MGSSSQAATQTNDPWAGAQPHLLESMGAASQIFQNGPGQYYPGQMTADLDPMTAAGWNMQADYLGNGDAQNWIDQQQGALGNAMNGGWYRQADVAQMSGPFGYQAAQLANVPQANAFAANTPQAPQAATVDIGALMGGSGAGGSSSINIQGGSNANIDAAVKAAQRSISDSHAESVMPGLRSGAIAAGQYGGSRQGIAEGIAAKGLQSQLGDVAARMYSDQYNQDANRAAQIAQAQLQADTQSQIARLNAFTGLAQFNAGAQNRFGELGYTTGADLSRFNAGQFNDMGRFNVGNALNAGQFNAGALNQAGQFNAGQAFDASQFNANSLNDMSRFNAGNWMNAGNQSLQALGMAPNIIQQNLGLGQGMANIGQGWQGYNQGLLDQGANRWNYEQSAPRDLATWYSQIINGTAGLGGTQTSTGPGPNRAAGALGGAAAGASFGPWGALIGAGLGYMGSK